MREAGALRGADQVVQTERGERAFAAGDRIMFQRNERGLGGDAQGRGGPGGSGGVAVKNGTLGTLGTVLAAEAGGERLTVRLGGPSAGRDGKDGRPVVTFYTRDYAHLDHGYAATVHKAQGVTGTGRMCSRRRTWTATRPMSGGPGTGTGWRCTTGATIFPGRCGWLARSAGSWPRTPRSTTTARTSWCGAMPSGAGWHRTARCGPAAVGAGARNGSAAAEPVRRAGLGCWPKRPLGGAGRTECRAGAGYRAGGDG